MTYYVYSIIICSFVTRKRCIPCLWPDQRISPSYSPVYIYTYTVYGCMHNRVKVAVSMPKTRGSPYALNGYFG